MAVGRSNKAMSEKGRASAGAARRCVRGRRSFGIGFGMNDLSESKRLADAINALAVTMTEIMTERLRAVAEGQEGGIGIRMAEPLIDKRVVASRMGFTVRALDSWMKRGLIPYYKIGRSVRFKWSEIERHLAAMESRGAVRIYR